MPECTECTERDGDSRRPATLIWLCDSGRSKRSPAMAAIPMLPNIKVVICGIILAVMLFVATGSGIIMPETYTRIGEMPKVGRPLVQQMMTAEPAQPQFHTLAATRRNEELAWLHERTALVVAEPTAVARDVEPPLLAAPSDRPNFAVPANVAQPTAEPSEHRSTAPSSNPQSARLSSEHQPVDAEVAAAREVRDDSDSRDGSAVPGAPVDPAVPVGDAAAAMPSAAPTLELADAGPRPGLAGGAFRKGRVPAPKEDPRDEAQRTALLGTHDDAASPPAPARPHSRARRPWRRHIVRRFHHFAAPEANAEPSPGPFGSVGNTPHP